MLDSRAGTPRERDGNEAGFSLAQLFAGSLTELRHPPAAQIPFLDGLRSIAILLVISGHLSADFVGHYGPTLYSRLPFVQNGWIGVDLFFVLSGFLIGGQLWKRLRQQGVVRVGDFMVRRSLRIWPLYFFVFGCVLLFAVTLGGGAAGKQYGWSDLLFLTNYHNRGLVEGSWSLCTEEQFYLVTPLALYLLVRPSRTIERCRPWLVLLLLLVPLLRAVVWVRVTGHLFGHDPALFSPLYYMSVTHCDGLIMGLLLANFWETRTVPASRLLQPLPLVLWAGVLTVALHLLQKEVFDFTALALLFGALVWFGVQRRTRVFRSRLFYWFSRLSFGMYLNHEYLAPWIVAHLPERFGADHRLAANLLSLALLILLSAAGALLTFCLVEHPFLRLRKLWLSRSPDTAAGGDFTPVTR